MTGLASRFASVPVIGREPSVAHGLLLADSLGGSTTSRRATRLSKPWFLCLLMAV